MASVISGCILSIVWDKSSKNSNFSFSPSKITVFVDTGFSIVAAFGRCWHAIPAFASARRLWEIFASEFRFLGVCSTIGNLLSFDTCGDRFWCCCDGGLRGVKMHPVRNWGISFVWAVCPVTMWSVFDYQSKRVSGTDNSLTTSAILFRVSSFTFDICNTILFSDAFSKEAVIPICSPRTEFVVTLVASCPGDVFIDLIANSILRATLLSITVEI